MVAKAKTKKQDNTMVEFRVVITFTCTHKGQYSSTRPRQTCADRGAISSPHCQIGALHWCHITSLGIYMVRKSTLVKYVDQLTLANGSEAVNIHSYLV